MVLGHLEYVQEKRKFDQDVELVLIAQEEISVALARTVRKIHIPARKMLLNIVK